MRLTSSKYVAVYYKKRERTGKLSFWPRTQIIQKNKTQHFFFEEAQRKINMSKWMLILSITIALLGTAAAFITRKHFDSIFANIY